MCSRRNPGQERVAYTVGDVKALVGSSSRSATRVIDVLLASHTPDGILPDMPVRRIL